MIREVDGRTVAALRRGEPAAFDAVYETYRARLFSFLLRLSRHRAVAEDLLEETWLRLISHAATLQPDTRLGAWLFTVARNLYWSYRRSAVLQEEAAAGLLSISPTPATWLTPFDLAAAGELNRRLEDALGRLPAHQREVLLLVGVEGLTPSEAAVVCNVKPDALRQRLARARAALAELLEPPVPAAPRGVVRYGTR